MKLNPQQQAAVSYRDGPLLVLAGAGSGKTRVITAKIASLIADGECPAQRIAAVTFTNKAAREMKQRIAQLVDREAAGKLRVQTFHSLGLNMLRIDAEAVGLRRGFSLFDQQDTTQLIKDILGGNPRNEDIDRVRHQVSRWKSDNVDPDEAAVTEMEQSARAYATYQNRLAAFNAVDFDDLIRLPVKLLEDAERRAAWQERIRYLLVDEYQDTNGSQYELFRRLVGERGAFTVVGDDDQSIYGWRGARPDNLARLEQDFPALKIIKLEQNYRSSGNILHAANTLISNNGHLFEKRLWSEHGPGDPIRVMACEDAESEARRVVSEILHGRFSQRLRFADCAILYRGNHQARIFEKALREHNIPYRLSGGQSFFERAEIKDLLCYLRLTSNPDDDAAFLRVVNTPRRELGSKTIMQVAEYAGRHDLSLYDAALADGLRASLAPRAAAALSRFVDLMIDVSDRGQRGDPIAAFNHLLERTAYAGWLKDQAPTPEVGERRVRNVDDLVSWLRRLYSDGDPRRSLSDLAAQVALLTSLDRDQDGGDEVQMMTLHSAKGLEFPLVLLAGFEEGLLPHHNSLEEGGEEEERRLAYVGITRAERRLVISYAARRRRMGEIMDCEVSRFLSELPETLLQWDQRDDAGTPQSKERGRAHLAGLKEMLEL